MGGVNKKLLVFSAAFAAILSSSTSPRAREGSLYPPSEEVVARGELARALGPAAYVLTGLETDAGFAEVVARAVAGHPTYLTGEAAVAEGRAGVRAERGALFPRISAGVNGDYVVDREFGADTENIVEALRPAGQANVGLSVSQLVFDGGETFARIRGAKSRVRARELTMADMVNNLILDTLTAYHDALAYEAISELGEEYIRRHEKLLADVDARFRRGVGSKADAKRAAGRLAAARARVVEIQQNASFAEIRYQEFFGAPPKDLKRPGVDALSLGSREEAVAAAMERHPALAAADARLDGAEADVRAAKAARLPDVNATFNATRFDVFDSDDYDIRAGVNLNYDLFAGGARGAAIVQAREAARQNRFDKERVALELARDAAIAYERQRAAEARLSAQSAALVAQYEARDLVSERFRVARGDLLDLLQAENDWFEAGAAYIVASAARDVAVYEVMSYTGDLLRLFAPSVDATGL